MEPSHGVLKIRFPFHDRQCLPNAAPGLPLFCCHAFTIPLSREISWDPLVVVQKGASCSLLSTLFSRLSTLFLASLQSSPLWSSLLWSSPLWSSPLQRPVSAASRHYDILFLRLSVSKTSYFCGLLSLLFIFANTWCLCLAKSPSWDPSGRNFPRKQATRERKN